MGARYGCRLEPTVGAPHGREAVDDEGDAALTLCAEAGHLEVALLLLQRGASPAQSSGWAASSALHIAMTYGQVAVVRALLEAGAPVDALDSLGQSALCRAAMLGHPEGVELLLDARADASRVDAAGVAILDHAWEVGDISI